MKFQSLITLSIFTFGIIAFSSCSKEETGCTDSKAAHFVSSADSDDGSCYYTGRATFWTAQSDAFGQVVVTINGVDEPITKDIANATGPESCTSCASCANYTLREGSYAYSATDGNTTLSGNITIMRDSCKIQRIKR